MQDRWELDDENSGRDTTRVTIEELHLHGNFSNFNLDSLVNLRELSIAGYIDKSFNFELFKNLCNQLENLNSSVR